MAGAGQTNIRFRSINMSVVGVRSRALSEKLRTGLYKLHATPVCPMVGNPARQQIDGLDSIAGRHAKTVASVAKPALASFPIATS